MAGEIPTFTSEKGVKVRNLEQVQCDNTSEGYSFRFEAEVNGQWFDYGPANMADWSMHSGRGGPFSVPIGFWELKTIWEKHSEVRRTEAVKRVFVNGQGEMLLADARGRSSDLAKDIAHKLAEGSVVTKADLELLYNYVQAIQGGKMEAE